MPRLSTAQLLPGQGLPSLVSSHHQALHPSCWSLAQQEQRVPLVSMSR